MIIYAGYIIGILLQKYFGLGMSYWEYCDRGIFS